jgi:hypothetical protein
MNKKAQGISMNVIIIAAIALLVLVILSVIFIGRMGSFGQQTGSCESQGGTCYDGSTCPQGTTTYDLECEEGQSCCLAVGVS